MTAKAQGIGDRTIHIHGNAAAHYIVQVTFRIRSAKARCLMDKAVFNGFHTGDELHASGCSQQMAHHGLGGADPCFVCLGSQSQLDGLRLKQVIVVGACAVGIDIIDLLRLYSGVLHSVFHGLCSPAAVLCRRGDMIGVAGGPIAR